VTHLLQDSAGAIWCGTAKGLYRIEQQSGQVVFHLVHVGMPTEAENHMVVTSIIEDSVARCGLFENGSSGSSRMDASNIIKKIRTACLPTIIHSLLEIATVEIWVAMEREVYAGSCLILTLLG